MTSEGSKAMGMTIIIAGIAGTRPPGGTAWLIGLRQHESQAEDTRDELEAAKGSEDPIR